MELNHKEYAFSFKSSSKALLPDSAAAQYQLLPSPSKIRYSSRVDSVITKMIKSMDTFAQGIREHVKGKVRLGTRILETGGVDKVFRHKFNIKDDDEKLLKASQCYLSTTSGPIAGLLFISNNRIAFCSDRSIKLSSPTGNLVKFHYKVMIPLGKIEKAVEIESENVKKPTHKYVKLVTADNFEFWFMGLVNHQTTFNYLQQAIHQSSDIIDTT